MLATALADPDPDPVLIFEETALYGVSGELADLDGWVRLLTGPLPAADATGDADGV